MTKHTFLGLIRRQCHHKEGACRRFFLSKESLGRRRINVVPVPKPRQTREEERPAMRFS